MKSLLFSMPLLLSGLFFSMHNGEPAVTKATAPTHTLSGPASPAAINLAMFARGIYPGDDTLYQSLKESGFTTIVLSSFYIRSNGDVLSGDDSKNPIIHDGKFVGDKTWLKRVADLKKGTTSITRIEILMEGRWYNQPPNTYDFIQNWAAPTETYPGIVTGTSKNSTLYNIAKIMKDEIGVDAVCIDDESVYDARSIVVLGEMLNNMNVHMTLCPYTKAKYWKSILAGSQPGLIDAIYLQCYDGGTGNEPGPWKDSLSTTLPVYPIMMCRGAFSSCDTVKNSKSPGEIRAEMVRYKKAYPGMTGGAIWQLADVRHYVHKNCAVELPSSGTATSILQYLDQLKNSLQGPLQQ
ncbi:hypothetical protein F0L74_10680 [Chitinophaga agrisoli]|uniref:Glycosyl hydrolase family 18 (Putative chitinase) n=1 Tax=Chitinophaga agrisoli TaxID=2607653 RepID=A0A5B2VWJ8_9BACT|nr:hypothetical protein [Chitinophaga agrisoli]KAA2242978.1 hypothetical protein F0L74_10680 [Chitinophaga agrisoli]